MDTRKISPTRPESEQVTSVPSGFRPWEDRSLPVEERFIAYKGHVAEQIGALVAAADKLGDHDFLLFERSSATQALLAHGEELQSMTAQEYCNWVERPHEIRRLLGRNFLGAEQWGAQGIDVGAIPPIPASITQELLESECPMYPGRAIKDTHLLVLVPKTVNGEPYSARKLDELCAAWKGEGAAWITSFFAWQSEPWASEPQASSEWVLIPDSDERLRLSNEEKSFLCREEEARGGAPKEYPDYRAAKTVELLTSEVLHYLTDKERFLSARLVQCKESSAPGGVVHVGPSLTGGLWDIDAHNIRNSSSCDTALARKVGA